ncbi:uncharacterized protein JCM15063_000371 [Sporobolomyces koalae]|uniref:uncharacterized protein n=1 Tax=Sporobolomyces koalae TaxID=500713 RepID=UPI00317728F5
MQDDLQPATAPSAMPATNSSLKQRVASYATNVLPTNYDFDSTLSLDENYMVLTLIYARLSMSKRGNMACIIVDLTSSPSPEPTRPQDAVGEPPVKRTRRSSSPSPTYPHYPGKILAHSNNFPLPHSVPVELVQKADTKRKQAAKLKPGQTAFLVKASQFPELHAEARSICLAAAAGTSLSGATAYVSFPPCAACLPLLAAAGVTRLVYRQTMNTVTSVELCAQMGIERVEVVDKVLDDRLKDQANAWWRNRGEGKDETRARLDQWWAEKEMSIMGEVYRKSAQVPEERGKTTAVTAATASEESAAANDP